MVIRAILAATGVAALVVVPHAPLHAEVTVSPFGRIHFDFMSAQDALQAGLLARDHDQCQLHHVHGAGHAGRPRRSASAA